MTKSSVKLWRERIDQGGVDAIDRPSKNKTYSQEFKLEVVRAFLDGEGGYRELTLEYGGAQQLPDQGLGQQVPGRWRGRPCHELHANGALAVRSHVLGR